MKQIRDAIVIGSGIIGSAIALALTRAGIRRVTLVEKGPLVSGMTRRNAGLVHPFQAHPLLCDLANASYDFYNQWAISFGGKSPFVETGAAVVSNFAAPERFAMWNAHANASEIEPAALTARYPNVTDQFRAVMFSPRAGYADAVITAQALVNAAKANGLEVQTGTQAKQIVVKQRHVQGVQTTTGELEAPMVVIAAGGWSERLLAPLGISLQLRFRRGIVEFYEQPPTITHELPMLLDANSTFFFRPHPYHMSAAGRVSLESQTQGIESLDEFVSASDSTSVKQFVEACLAEFANVSTKRAHPILYDTPKDGLPALGRIANIDGLYVAVGFGTSAFAVAPAVGETLAQLLVDGSAARDVSSFSPLR